MTLAVARALPLHAALLSGVLSRASVAERRGALWSVCEAVPVYCRADAKKPTLS